MNFIQQQTQRLPVVMMSGLLFMLTACDSSGGGGSALSITATNPAEGASNVLTNTTPSVTFSADMDASSLTASSFSLAGGSPVSGAISYDATSRTATFTPATALTPDTEYTATLTTTVTDSGGMALSAGYDWRFRSEAFIKRVSVDSTGAEATGSSDRPIISADGRYVAFQSAASNLVSGDTNGSQDIFVHDTQSATTTRVSVDSSGSEATGGSSSGPALSADGRYVAFRSAATNLVSSDTNSDEDIFVHDTQTGTTTRVSVDSSGTEATGGHSYDPALSADGRYVAFRSTATNLVSGDNNGASDIFVHDTQTGATTRVSVDSSGSEATGGSSYSSALSADGRYVAFESAATNLVSGDSNVVRDIFVHDTQTGATTRVSVDSSGIEATGGHSYDPALSADGRYVAFRSTATNLVSGDNNGASDIFVHDTQTGATTRVSVDSTGAEATGGNSSAPVLSANGRYVAFASSATNLVSGDTNGNYDIFVHDTQTGATTRVSVDSTGAEATGGNNSNNPALSADGRYVAFGSAATNLAPGGDTNGAIDVFRVLNTTP